MVCYLSVSHSSMCLLLALITLCLWDDVTLSIPHEMEVGALCMEVLPPGASANGSSKWGKHYVPGLISTSCYVLFDV